MRPKFRAWINGEMIYIKGDVYIEFFNDPTCVDWCITHRMDERTIYSHDSFYEFEYKNNVLMQFIGLTDKNGKEIWEGDVVRFIDDVTIPNKPCEVITEVFWWNEMGCYSMKNTYMELNFTTVDEIEVIGNKFERHG